VPHRGHDVVRDSGAEPADGERGERGEGVSVSEIRQQSAGS
jgi:hypothetical protein